MKMKKFFNLLAVCAMSVLPFTSCNDDDEELLAPEGAVSGLSFTDIDIDEGKIGGTLTWTLPGDEAFVEDYVIYQGESATSKTTKLGEVSKGTTSFEIPEGTNHLAYLIVVARNVTGESSNNASLSVNDNTGPVVLNAKFTDTDLSYMTIGGTLTWTLPASEDGITGYAIYAGNNATDKETLLGEVAAGKTSFEVPEGTGYKAYLLIVSKDNSGESKDFATVAIEDSFEYGGLYVLNSGNKGANNASLSYYDLIAGTMTTNIYKTVNGSGLGELAEQLLIYGSKMYITVYGSNRIVVLDLNGKLLNTIEPTSGTNEPVNPRRMAADNGKIYISYFSAHSVAALDTASLKIEQVVSVGRYPEHLTVANGKIYVANSGGLDYPNYGKTVSVINQGTFKVEKEIEVALNPEQVVADSQGDVYVISLGNYGDVKNTLQRIDATTNEVTVMDYGTNMTLANDQLYVMYGQWGDPNITFKKYDTLTETVVNDNFVTGRTFSGSNTYRLGVDPTTGKIYISEAPYGATSSLLIFGANGNFEKEVETGGYGTRNVVFF